MRREFHIPDLHPIMREPVQRLMVLCQQHPQTDDKGQKWIWCPFEGYRSPDRQEQLYNQGGVTRARSWQSSHQFGLAVDMVPQKVSACGAVEEGTWNWEANVDWSELHRLARSAGLRGGISWDLVHIWHPEHDTAVRHIRG